MYRRTRELLTEEQREQLTKISPTLDEWELGAYYTLTEQDRALIRRRRRDENRIGFAIQLCVLRHTGWPLSEINEVPNRVLHYIANQIDVDPDAFQRYAVRETTRWEHMREIRKEYGYRSFTVREYRQLAKALLPQAMEKDHAMHLIHRALHWLRERKIILPAITTVERLVWETRRRAEEKIYRLLNAALTSDQKKQLEELIRIRMENGKTPLGWIKEDPGQSSPRACKKAIEQRNQILKLGLEVDTQGIHPQRLRQLARLGRNYDPQAFRRFPETKRYAILVAYLLELCQDITDQIIEISRRQIANLHASGRKAQDEIQKQNGKALNEKIVRFVDLTTVLLEAKKKGQDLDEAIASTITWERLAQERDEARALTRPANYDYLDLVKNRYNYLRQYTPTFLDVMQFRSTQAAAPLLEAVDVIRDLNRSGKRKVPEDAPLEFLPDRWLPYVMDDQGRINKVYYEMATMTELHNRIRSGDVSVVGSRQHKDFEEYLVSKEEWEQVRATGNVRLAVPLSVEEYLEERTQAIWKRLEYVSKNLNRLEDARLEDGSLHVDRLEKETPPEAEELSDLLYAMLPRVKLTELLAEVAYWTGFDETFIHASTGHPPKGDEKAVVLAALMAMGTNIGLTKMSDATPDISYRQMANAVQWRMYDDAMKQAQKVLVRFHQKLPLARYWGDGTTSSSDGMRVQVGVSSLHAETNPHYGRGKGATFYRFVSDQQVAFHDLVINATAREAPYVIDGYLNHETDLQIEEHYTDTAGYTDQVFGLAHLFGFRFAPRLRDLHSARLFTIESADRFPRLNEFLRYKIRTPIIRKNYDDVLRMAHSIQQGTVSAALLMGKLGSYERKNELSKALQEMGRIEKTIFLLDYVSDKALRRRVQRGLNKGESMNSLARAIFFGKRGKLRERALNDQLQRASALSLLINAISIWNTVYLTKAVEALRKTRSIPETLISHISPLGWNHINFLGEYKFSLDRVPSLNNLRPLNPLGE
ncbi:MAG: Tn3 family transposase [Firmicutes bacterium]|nr:Tn3 family transposase [Bacillota bacterium]